mmetsp:Transcript_3546/g.6861  ORF Transcript_3546/g.6861 Transcript_3546/m.6861 type:complete len:664 (-) Transcript_3546:109-2100(-)|eukprot:CAMPEP_0172677238 /NCGR_PEP_ID=MMETSP1074-20121228/14538_1 /TAXON_ID=2916 /ORGANISM="Ceratium fusus, Strain PA161109" /LENGTH=663 /DNA_ID=CAMNT_0013495045 /DNA_START=61 /DNA_END=2052 /DNA_ORIENTATION=-
MAGCGHQMKPLLRNLACLLSLVQAAPKPHVVFLLADDFGWGNLGIHRRSNGSELEDLSMKQARAEVHTPQIDALADAGIVLDRHYSYSVCAPSRSALQTGRLSVHVNMENNDNTVFNPKDLVSGSAGIPRNMTGIAQKLRMAGYRTHAVGKWGVGAATPQHTPHGRGYETWIGYFGHANDYWRKTQDLISIGSVDVCMGQFIDFSMHNATYRGGVRDAVSLSAACRDDHESDPACYEEHIFREHALAVINEHNVSKVEEPLFLFYAFHLVHSPLQVPHSYLEQIDRLVAASGGDPFNSKDRRHYAAMALYMDDAVGAVVSALKRRHMWDNTLLVFLSDNGGPIYEPGAANNYPLKGGKYSDWEGGIRTNALVSGGFVPRQSRGTTFSGVVSNADWYATLCELAGVDPEDHAATAANKRLREQHLPLLRGVDGIPQWGFILNGTNGRQAPLHISAKSVMHWPYKLITGKQLYSAWQGPVYPNCSTVASAGAANGPSFADLAIFNLRIALSEKATWTQDCGAGCLFNVEVDPTEHHNLAGLPKHAATVARLQRKLRELNRDLFRPDRGNDTIDACMAFIDNGGYYGPFKDVDGWYSPRPALTRKQQLADAASRAFLNALDHEVIRQRFTKIARAGLNIGEWLRRLPAQDVCIANQSAVPPETILI